MNDLAAQVLSHVKSGPYKGLYDESGESFSDEDEVHGHRSLLPSILHPVSFVSFPSFPASFPSSPSFLFILPPSCPLLLPSPTQGCSPLVTSVTNTKHRTLNLSSY